MSSPLTPEALEELASKRAGAKLGWYVHATVYVLVNLLINAPFITVAEAADLGVRRISVGGALARTAWAGFLHAAKEIADGGTFACFEGLPKVDAMFLGR